jgi:SSS family solute:Na+ symporter
LHARFRPGGSAEVFFDRFTFGGARRSYIVNAITDVTIGALLALCGLALLAFYLKYPSFLPEGILTTENGQAVVKRADRVMPYFFAHQLPAGIGGVIFAVLLCDAMQTLVSGVNSISAVFTSDIFNRVYPEGRRWMSDLNLARLLTVVIGLIVTALGMGVARYALTHPEKNIIDMMAPAFNMFLGPMASLFLIGMFLKCRAGTVLVASLCGMVISFLWSYWQALFDTSWQPSITLTTAVPYLASFAIAFFLTKFVERDMEHPGREYTWSAIMRRPLPSADPEEDSVEETVPPQS